MGSSWVCPRRCRGNLRQRFALTLITAEGFEIISAGTATAE